MSPTTIKKRSTFLSISRNGKRAKTDSVIVICCKNDDNAVLVGYTASRRVGCAVLRNFAKRRLRELVREFRGDLMTGYSYVFIATTETTNCSFAKLKQDFSYGLQKVKSRMEIENNK